MMTIRIEINGKEIECFEVVNDGGPNAATEYLVRDVLRRRNGRVTHDRDKGAVVLATAALADMARRWRS